MAALISVVDVWLSSVDEESFCSSRGKEPESSRYNESKMETGKMRGGGCCKNCKAGGKWTKDSKHTPVTPVNLADLEAAKKRRCDSLMWLVSVS